jgi:predicted metal-dependent enzyme (double-stranded beta helix superfamily)
VATEGSSERLIAAPLPPRLLAAIALDHADVARFDDVARPAPFERTFARVQRTATYDVWLIRWGQHSRASLHDHGDSAGVLGVVAGELVEYQPNPEARGHMSRRVLRRSARRLMSPSHVHEVVNESPVVAASVHVYSPPLDVMHHYEIADANLRIVPSAHRALSARRLNRVEGVEVRLAHE